MLDSQDNFTIPRILLFWFPESTIHSSLSTVVFCGFFFPPPQEADIKV